MNILENDLVEVEYKWENGDFHSCEIHDLGRHDVIYEIIIICNIDEPDDLRYYKVLYEGELEGWNPFDDVKDDFVRVHPTRKLVTIYEEV